MARKKRKKRVKHSPILSNAEILDKLRVNFLAELTSQITSGKNTESKFSVLAPEERSQVKTEAKIRFAELTPSQRKKLKKKPKK